jgi:hypothetical protein
MIKAAVEAARSLFLTPTGRLEAGVVNRSIEPI